MQFLFSLLIFFPLFSFANGEHSDQECTYEPTYYVYYIRQGRYLSTYNNEKLPIEVLDAVYEAGALKRFTVKFEWPTYLNVDVFTCDKNVCKNYGQTVVTLLSPVLFDLYFGGTHYEFHSLERR